MNAFYIETKATPNTIINNTLMYAIKLTAELTAEVCICPDSQFVAVEIFKGGYSIDDVLDANIDYDNSVSEAQFKFDDLEGIDMTKVYAELVA